MKIYYPDGCEQEWREALTPWQKDQLVRLHLQGRRCADRTDHGSDYRWLQAGVKTYDRWRGARRRRRKDGHVAVVIRKTDYGFRMAGLARAEVLTVDPETGQETSVQGFSPVWQWFVGPNSSGNMERNYV